MLEPKAKTKTKNFLRHIELLGQNSTDRIVEGFETTEKELINNSYRTHQTLLNTMNGVLD